MPEISQLYYRKIQLELPSLFFYVLYGMEMILPQKLISEVKV